MKTISTVLLSVTLMLAGCSDASRGISTAKKDGREEVLSPEFVEASIPKERREDLDGILGAFKVGRNPGEFVRRVNFTSDTSADVFFSDGGPHGGGQATMKKTDGHWAIEHKGWYM